MNIFLNTWFKKKPATGQQMKVLLSGTVEIPNEPIRG